MAEICGWCKATYETIYRVSDEVWRELTGHADGSGLVCPNCLDQMARRMRRPLFWEAAIGHYPMGPPQQVESFQEGVSDGLCLPCSVCGRVPVFDYRITGDFWNRIVPAKWRLGVICLECLDAIAVPKGEVVGRELEEVQFTGLAHTVLFRPYKIVGPRARDGIKAEHRPARRAESRQ